MTSWDGGVPTWHAQGVFVKFGPQIVKVCATKTGARLRAWRRQRAHA